MYKTINLTNAKRMHHDIGGYLLNLGDEPQRAIGHDETKPADAVVRQGAICRTVYCVCDYSEAIDLGRTPEQLEALSPSYQEV